MNSTQFTEQLHKRGYETTTDGGAIIIIGKHDSFEENLKEARELVKEYGYECSWGVKGGTTAADVNGKKKQAAMTTTKLEENNPVIDTTGSFEQMSLMDFM